VSKLSLVREFWDETPCDGQATYDMRYRLRYEKEPWLLSFLQRVAARHHSILEVGCGQGTDGVTLCKFLSSDSRYIGVDMSEVSLDSARAAAESASPALQVTPNFKLDNAERLSFADGTFDCVLSIGALHHSEDTAQAIAEVKRVLAPGGTAFIFLYRRLSPKLLVAHALRRVQEGVDKLLGTDRAFYKLARARPLPENLGTAVYECFGVPILRSYTKSQMQALFSDFSSLQLSCHGVGLPPLGINQLLEAPAARLLGYLWLAEAVKG